MHRRMIFVGSSGPVTALAGELGPLDGVIALTHHPGVALKPPGDLLVVDALNRTADDVLRRARAHAVKPAARLTVVLFRSSAIIDGQRKHLIETDADEALWEEMEADLRNHGRVSVNYALLMALGGIIAAIALPLDVTSQTIGFVAASIIAPAFEPVAKLAQSLVLRQPKVCAQAVLSIVVGYAVLFAAAWLALAGLNWLQPGEVRQLLDSAVVDPLSHVKAGPLLSSAAAAVAGVVMIVSLRDVYVVGPLIALVTIPGVVLGAAGLVLGRVALTLGAVRRVGVDLLLVVVLGGAVFAWKQRRFHRRRPLE